MIVINHKYMQNGAREDSCIEVNKFSIVENHDDCKTKNYWVIQFKCCARYNGCKKIERNKNKKYEKIEIKKDNKNYMDKSQFALKLFLQDDKTIKPMTIRHQKLEYVKL